ncbi:MAG: DUF4445 domain-containing protein [Chloroflexi bacterium]|nr:DUF4445 domain-containing protein [Chloroflexota bacterium]MBU1746297.1 DUF4445 domain-containing protein [Chloroflexota bacterium]
MTSYRVEFEPVGRRGACSAEQSLLDCARHLGVDLATICGGAGTCGRCRVQVVTGAVSEPTAWEREAFTPAELEAGHRLACQTWPRGDCRVRVPPESLTAPQRTQIESLPVPVTPDPPVRAHPVHLAPASLTDLRADDARLLAALPDPAASVDLAFLRELSPRLRAGDWQGQAIVRESEVVAWLPRGARPLGLAVDLGTTKIAGYLLDLESGETLAAQGAMNPQIAYGEDVIARLARAMTDPTEAARLHALVADALNQLATDLCAAAGCNSTHIVEAVVVGNTAMHHLFLRLPLAQLARAPYVPAVAAALDVKAREVGLGLAPGAYVHLLPNIAGFVGADHVAMLLAVGLAQAEDVALALDIGTNTEVCLAHRGALTSVSCASGPAFEGAHITHGMRAAPGAIEHVRIEADRVDCQTIGGAPPVGLCGSGILDALAQLRRAGVVDRNGKLGEHPRAHGHGQDRAFVLVDAGERPAITITQHDIRELQLAKGAIRAGVQVLLNAQGLTAGDIDRVVIAGAFGSYIDVESATTIGMLPALPLDRFTQVGNAAGAGARLALISRQQRAQAQALADRVSYIELAAAPDFTHTFAEAMFLD